MDDLEFYKMTADISNREGGSLAITVKTNSHHTKNYATMELKYLFCSVWWYLHDALNI